MAAPKAALRNCAAANADARIRAPASATATNPGFTQILARQLDWLDRGAKIIQQPDCLCDGSSYFRIDASIRRLGPQSDPRTLENALLQHERRQLADALIPVVDIPPGHCAEHCGNIFR
jgi:hypothetical protein